MAEATVLVCDVCGRPAVESVTFRIGGRNRVKDLCQVHLAELEAGSRAPRRGRKSAALLAGPPSTGKRRGRSPGSRNKNPSGNGRRRGRPPKTSASPTGIDAGGQAV
jgi:hypothetical protein